MVWKIYKNYMPILGFSFSSLDFFDDFFTYVRIEATTTSLHVLVCVSLFYKEMLDQTSTILSVLLSLIYTLP